MSTASASPASSQSNKTLRIAGWAVVAIVGERRAATEAEVEAIVREEVGAIV